MASFFNLFLDTTVPKNVVLTLDGGAVYTTNPDLILSITLDDIDTAGYQMKIWGIVGAETEADAVWEDFAKTKNVSLLDGQGLKTVYAKVRDSVYNESAVVSDTITLLDENVPTVTVIGPDVARISKKAGKNVSTFTFMADKKIVEWKIMVVQDTSATVDTSTNVLIQDTNGSVNMSGTTETEANAPILCSIRGEDLEIASNGDGTKIVKVFVKSEENVWSIA